MARFLPSSSDPPQSDADPRVVGVDSDDAGDLLSALSSDTARDILAALHETPAAPSEIADRAETTLQNAQYHISKLTDAGLIEVVDTVYSEKGREMKVYAPTDRPLIVFAGPEEETSGLKAALSRLLGAVGLLALAAFVLRRVVGMFSMGSAPGGAGDSATVTADGGAGGAAATTAPSAGSGGAAETLTDGTKVATEEATRTALETATATVANDGGAGLLASPALYLVAGVAAVLLVWAALRYYRT